MEEPPASLSTTSVHLSRVLDEIGLNELTVTKRRETSLYNEEVQSVYHEMFSGVSVYYFGSQSEGTTTTGLNADVDSLNCHQGINIIQDLSEWEQGQINLLMLRESSAPAYCRLQLIKLDKPEQEVTLPNKDYIKDENNRVILTNKVLDHYTRYNLQKDKNGPATTLHLKSGIDADMTNALLCRSKLDASEKWAERKRRSGWPTLSLINRVVNEPFFLVPVGYKLSIHKSIEFRISTSLAERCLMFSLNMVQIKCYTTLKILMKSFVVPAVGKGISSYHCKMALLYCVESTDADFWQEDNLLQSITRCLEMLLAWVTDEFCPHFIIAEANLFAGKVTSKNKGTFQSFLRLLISKIVYSLLDISMDGLGQKLHMKFGTKPNNSPILDSVATKQLLAFLEVDRHVEGINIDFLIHLPSFYQTDILYSNVLRAIIQLKSQTNFSNELQQEATEHIIRYLSSFLGSLLTSVLLGSNQKISQEAIELLDVSVASDISFLLKKASVTYCIGNVEKMEQLCKTIRGYFAQNIVYSNCKCFSHRDKYSNEQLQTMYNRRQEIRYAQCVRYTLHEIHCVPQALRYEMFRAVGDDISHRQRLDGWMDLAVVDCYPFLFYLQYMTYRELGKVDIRKQSLYKLEQCIREENQHLSHVETAWNILGQCYEIEKQSVAALQCYRHSLDVRSRNNAANWLVTMLLYRCTQ